MGILWTFSACPLEVCVVWKLSDEFDDIFLNRSSPWHYKCDGGLCKKELITEQTSNPVALKVCQLSCGQGGTLWPKPTGHLSLGNTVVQLNPGNIVLTGISQQTVVGNLLQKNVERLEENIKKLAGPLMLKGGGVGLKIHIASEDLKVDDAKLTLETDENYTLRIAQVDGQVNKGSGD